MLPSFIPHLNSYDTIDIQNSEFIPEHLNDKKSILDIYAKTKEGIHINIEIQMANKNDMKERTLYYWSRIFTGQMQKGSAYSDLS